MLCPTCRVQVTGRRGPVYITIPARKVLVDNVYIETTTYPECPICLKGIESPLQPFNCGHCVCDVCYHKLQQRFNALQANIVPASPASAAAPAVAPNMNSDMPFPEFDFRGHKVVWVRINVFFRDWMLIDIETGLTCQEPIKPPSPPLYGAVKWCRRWSYWKFRESVTNDSDVEFFSD